MRPGPSSAQRLGRLEDADGDFPFYNGQPKVLSGGAWALVLGAVAVAFGVLVQPIPWPAGPLGPLIPAALFAAIPLLALAWVAPGHAGVLFRPVRGRELRLMLGFAALTLAVSLAVGVVVRLWTEMAPNAATAQLGEMDAPQRIAFFLKTLPQLLGEELVTVLPFLAVLSLLTRRYGVGRRKAILAAWLLSSLIFGLIHLPTYDWNFIQCVVVIGSARLVLTLPWILTKNLWVSTGAHIVNDWTLFGLALLGASRVGQA